MAGDETPLPPAPGSPVTVVLDDLRVRARVEQSDAGGLLLAVAAAPTQVGRAGVDVRVEFLGDRGPCRMLGSVTLTLSDATREPRLRFSPHGPPQLLIRSERVRAPVEMEIQIEAGGEVVTRSTHDLRASGALVPGPFELAVDDTVGFGLQLPTRTEPLKGTARVARVTSDGDVAIQFLELSPADAADLTLAVFEAQRGRAA